MMCGGLFAALAPARRSLYRVYKNPPGTLSNSYASMRTCAMQVKDLRAKLDPDIRYRRDQQAPEDIPRTTESKSASDGIINSEPGKLFASPGSAQPNCARDLHVGRPRGVGIATLLIIPNLKAPIRQN